MIANLGTEMDDIDETISTCRFAQRCARVVNEMRINETVSIDIVLKGLQNENTRLKKYIYLYIYIYIYTYNIYY